MGSQESYCIKLTDCGLHSRSAYSSVRDALPTVALSVEAPPILTHNPLNSRASIQYADNPLSLTSIFQYSLHLSIRSLSCRARLLGRGSTVLHNPAVRSRLQSALLLPITPPSYKKRPVLTTSTNADLSISADCILRFTLHSRYLDTSGLTGHTPSTQVQRLSTTLVSDL